MYWACTAAGAVTLSTADPAPFPFRAQKEGKGPSVQNNKTGLISLNFKTKIISDIPYIGPFFSFKNARTAVLNFLSLPIFLWKNTYYTNA